MKDTQFHQLISSLNKDTQLMRIIVIQPPKVDGMPTENITKFKLNMGQFSVIDKVDLFKQPSEIICSNFISSFVFKEKLQIYFKGLENKLKIKSLEKKALLIKNSYLEKEIKEISKGKGKETLNSLILEKDAEIQNLKKVKNST